MNPNIFTGFSGLESLFDRPRSYLQICEDNDIPLPLEYFVHVFYLLPTPVCERFNWSFEEFFDYIMRKGDLYES